MDALSARVLVSKPLEGDYRVHLLIVERGDPSSDRFERLEVPVDVGIVTESTASVRGMRCRSWSGRRSRLVREQALLLLFWIFWKGGAGVHLETDSNINSVSAGDLLRAAMDQIRKDNGV